MRKIMTAAELREHRAGEHGRNCRRSSDGYDDMNLAEETGWHALSSWGRDGWNLGDWPYVVIYTRTSGYPDTSDRVYELMQVCEGDHTEYRFDHEEDRSAALDYLFLWYAAGRDWAPLTWEQRTQLDAGKLEVDEKFRGPYRPRLEPLNPAQEGSAT